MFASSEGGEAGEREEGEEGVEGEEEEEGEERVSLYHWSNAASKWGWGVGDRVESDSKVYFFTYPDDPLPDSDALLVYRVPRGDLSPRRGGRVSFHGGGHSSLVSMGEPLVRIQGPDSLNLSQHPPPKECVLFPAATSWVDGKVTEKAELSLASWGRMRLGHTGTERKAAVFYVDAF